MVELWVDELYRSNSWSHWQCECVAFLERSALNGHVACKLYYIITRNDGDSCGHFFPHHHLVLPRYIIPCDRPQKGWYEDCPDGNWAFCRSCTFFNCLPLAMECSMLSPLLGLWVGEWAPGQELQGWESHSGHEVLPWAPSGNAPP